VIRKKVLLEKEQRYNFSEVLYDGACPKCKDNVDWEANFDADGTTYFAECCELKFWMGIETVKVDIEKSEDNE